MISRPQSQWKGNLCCTCYCAHSKACARGTNATGLYVATRSLRDDDGTAFIEASIVTQRTGPRNPDQVPRLEYTGLPAFDYAESRDTGYASSDGLTVPSETTKVKGMVTVLLWPLSRLRPQTSISRSVPQDGYEPRAPASHARPVLERGSLARDGLEKWRDIRGDAWRRQQ
jgi:hypothetical protein